MAQTIGKTDCGCIFKYHRLLLYFQVVQTMVIFLSTTIFFDYKVFLLMTYGLIINTGFAGRAMCVPYKMHIEATGINTGMEYTLLDFIY